MLPVAVIACLSITSFDHLSGTLAVAREKKGSHGGLEPGNKPLMAITQIAIEIIKFAYLGDIAEYVLVQCVKQQREEIGIPYRAEAEINLGMEKGTFAQLK